MADIDSIVTTLIKTVSQILIAETKTILNASADLKSLQVDLKFMQEFLRHSEGERVEVKEDVKQFRVLVLEAENLIDNFVVKMAMHKRRNSLQRFFRGGERIILLRDAAARVKDMRNQINRIIGNRKKFSIPSDKGAVSKRSTIQSLRHHVEMQDVVCFDNEAKLVMEKLDTEYSERDVVSIIGMGGLGKTTLARKIYNGDFVKNFDCAAWVDVSQVYNLKDLLKRIANAVLPKEEMEEFNKQELLLMTNRLSTEEGEEKLVQMLKNGLEVKRYFIVLDDVWESLLWNEIKAAFPENGKRSRVLITSRVKEVALHASTHTDPYFLPFLDEDDSWKLLSRKVFHDQVCLPDQEEFIRNKILSKCKGLPLAIVVVAGLLKKRDQSMWPKIANDLKRYISQDSSDCLGILALSYEELPPHLKPCFLYFGVYPEDFEIPVNNLIRLWVAEGFADQDNDMEDAAEEYLLELIDRSLIQVASERWDGRVKTCRIHDLLRDLAISKGESEMFLSVDRKLDGSLPDTQPRRLSVHYGSRGLRYNYLSGFSQLRSFLSFGDYKKTKINQDKDPFNRRSKFGQYLRVWDHGSDKCYNFPPKVEKLVQLRYLRINAQEIDEIPSSISKLVNLQILNVQEIQAERFRCNIWEMQQLRHLHLYDWTRIIIPKGNGITELSNLCTLSGFSLYSEDEAEILKRLPNLKKLKVHCFVEDLGVFEYLSNLEHFKTLNISHKFQFTDPGALPSSLTRITLKKTGLDLSAFSKLGGLPNLQVLKLINSFCTGSKLETGSSDQGQFPKLQVLIFEYLDVREWSIEDQAFQSLVHLSIYNSPLIAIPDQLNELKSLRQVKVSRCHALRERLLLNGIFANVCERNLCWVDDPRLIFW